MTISGILNHVEQTVVEQLEDRNNSMFTEIRSLRCGSLEDSI
jgi:hypothetical protein